MLIFYTIVSALSFFLLGMALIGGENNNKSQKTAGSIFIGLSSLGFFCLLIEYLILRGSYV